MSIGESNYKKEWVYKERRFKIKKKKKWGKSNENNEIDKKMHETNEAFCIVLEKDYFCKGSF